MLIFFPWRKSP